MSAARALDRPTEYRSKPWVSSSIARRLLAMLVLALSAVPLPDPAAAQASTGYEVTVTGERTKQQFVAGYREHISANVADDVFAAGREVTIGGARAHAVFIAGDKILVKESTLRDLFAGGQEIEIQGTIEDDAMVAVCPVCPWGSGRLLLGSAGRIGDDALLVAGTLEIQGTIGGDLSAIARRIVIAGTVSGRADLTANEIVIALPFPSKA